MKCVTCESAGRVYGPYCRSCRYARTKASLERRRASGDLTRERERKYHREWEWRKKAKDPNYLRFGKMWRRYKITRERFYSMLAHQGGVCAICSAPFKSISKMQIDHDHACCPGMETCGKCVRGILHPECNKMLGMVRDDPAVLEAAAIYLRSS